MKQSAGVVAVMFLVVLVGAPAGAETEPAQLAPVLAFAGHPKPVLRVVDGAPLATATVVLSNTGTADAAGVTFLLLGDKSEAIEACGVQDITATGVGPTSQSCNPVAGPLAVAKKASKRLAVTFRVEQPARIGDPLIQAQSSLAGTASAFAEVTMSRSLSEGRLWWPLAPAGAAGLLVLVMGYFATRRAVNRRAEKSDGAVVRTVQLPWRRARVYTAAAWKFTDSWITSIAALGGVLGTVLAATGFFNEVFPGVSAGRFTGFSLLFGGLALMAPVVYTLLGSQDSVNGETATVGTVGGLIVASAVTVAAIGGQLAALGLLVWMSDASSLFQLLCFAGLVIATGVVIAYAVRGAAWLSMAPKPKPAEPKAGERRLWGPSPSGSSGVP